MKKILSILAMLLAFATPALADGEAAAATGGGMTGMIIYFVVIIAVFYFLLIRPQKKKEKEAQAMIDAIKKGDKITTIGGFHGKVVSVKNGVITLQMGENKVKLDSWAVKSVDKAAEVKEAAEIEEPEVLDTVEETEE